LGPKNHPHCAWGSKGEKNGPESTLALKIGEGIDHKKLRFSPPEQERGEKSIRKRSLG